MAERPMAKQVGALAHYWGPPSAPLAKTVIGVSPKPKRAAKPATKVPAWLMVGALWIALRGANRRRRYRRK